MDDALLADLEAHIGDRVGPVFAWDPVNAPMIRHWREALGFETPDSGFAPATMLPVWLMAGLCGKPAPNSDLRDHRAIMKLLEREGYAGILGTNCEQSYVRRLRPGETVSSTYEVEHVSARKQTKFGPGYFVTFLQTFRDEAGAEVGTMRLRIMRFRPEAARPAPPQPSMSADTRFFWDGLREGKLLIQRCAGCGLLRHPPGPACTECHSLAWDTLESAGMGEIYSFVIVHKPVFEAYAAPHPVGLIALDEGVRLVAPLATAERERVAIGSRVKAVFAPPDDVHRMPIFHLVESA